MKKEYRRFLKYLIPSVLSMIVVSAYSFTDTFVVGRALGASGLAAIGIATPVLTTLFSLGFLFGTGGGAAYAVSRGKGDSEKARQIYTTSILLTCVTGLVIMVLGLIFIRDIAVFLGADETTIGQTVEYMRWLFVFAPMLILDLTTNNFMRNDGKPGVAMAATMIGSGANIVLDLLFVFVFGWGMFGASIATCMGSVIAVCINLGYSAVHKLDLRLIRVKPVFKDICRILSNGFGPFLLNFSVSVLTFVYIASAQSHYGDVGVSAYTILMNWNLIFMNMMLGVVQSSQPLISLNFGQGNNDAVQSYRKMTLRTALIFGLCFFPLGLLGATPLSLVFVNDAPDLVALAVQALRLSSITYIFMAVTMSIGYYFEALEKPKESLAVMLLRGFLCPVAALYFFSAIWQGDGMWLSIPAAEAVSAIAACLLMRRTQIVCHTLPAVQPDTHAVHPVITISREFGSGGREIGRRLAANLDIPMFDKEMQTFTAVESGLAGEVVADAEEKKQGGFEFGLYKKDRYVPISDRVFLAQSRVIKGIADRQSAVIVGRCADAVLRDYCPCVNVFIHAPLAQRIARVKEYDHCSEQKAQEKILESDAARARYHEHYVHTAWGMANEYDLTINSAIGFDEAVAMIAQVYRSAVIAERAKQ